MSQNFKKNHLNLLAMAEKINDEILLMKNWFDEIPQLVAIMNGDRFIKVNKMFERVLGWTPSEIVKMQWISLIHPDDIQPTFEVSSADGIPVFSFFNRYKTKCGNYIWLQWSISTIKNKETYISAIPHYDNSPLFGFLKNLEEQRKNNPNKNNLSNSEDINPESLLEVCV